MRLVDIKAGTKSCVGVTSGTVNGCSGRIGENGLPASHVTRNCSKPWDIQSTRLLQALLDGRQPSIVLWQNNAVYMERRGGAAGWLKTPGGRIFSGQPKVCCLDLRHRKTRRGIVVDISSDGAPSTKCHLICGQFNSSPYLSELVLKLATIRLCSALPTKAI